MSADENTTLYSGTATFYMKSGNKIEIVGDSLNIKASTSSGEITGWEMNGVCDLKQALHITPEQIEAVVWDPTPVTVVVNEDRQSAVVTRGGEVVTL
jgi:hypothetical protein